MNNFTWILLIDKLIGHLLHKTHVSDFPNSSPSLQKSHPKITSFHLVHFDHFEVGIEIVQFDSSKPKSTPVQFKR